jgi:hypothetical protein
MPRVLVDVFGDEVRSLRFRNAKLSQVVGALLEKLNLPESHAHLVRGGLRIAQKVDESGAGQPSYHNQYHIAEVVMAAFILGKRERLPEFLIAEIVVAAAGHDLGHPGHNNTAPFEIETLSFNIAAPILTECGWNEAELHRFRQMLMATDFVNGVPFARSNYLETRSLPPESAAFCEATQCIVLTEADILFSCFTTEYNEELSKLLSQEWNLPTANLTVKQRLGFLNSVTFLSGAARQLGLEHRRLALVAELEDQLRAGA